VEDNDRKAIIALTTRYQPKVPISPDTLPNRIADKKYQKLKKLERRKRKGDFSCEISPFLSAFVEDLVRLPNHNVVIPKSFVARELGPRFLHFSGITLL
jgi:hypothetical protein